jgi:hypothetical protein
MLLPRFAGLPPKASTYSYVFPLKIPNNRCGSLVWNFGQLPLQVKSLQNRGDYNAGAEKKQSSLCFFEHWPVPGKIPGKRG